VSIDLALAALIGSLAPTFAVIAGHLLSARARRNEISAKREDEARVAREAVLVADGVRQALERAASSVKRDSDGIHDLVNGAMTAARADIAAGRAEIKELKRALAESKAEMETERAKKRYD
jgi:hypothetical protein